MVWESTLTCFNSGGWDGISCILGQGVMNMAGTQLLAGMLMIGIMVYASFKMRLPWTFTISAMVIFGIVMTFKYLENWIGALLILIALFLAGYGFYKWWKGRG